MADRTKFDRFVANLTYVLRERARECDNMAGLDPGMEDDYRVLKTVLEDALPRIERL